MADDTKVDLEETIKFPENTSQYKSNVEQDMMRKQQQQQMMQAAAARIQNKRHVTLQTALEIFKRPINKGVTLGGNGHSIYQYTYPTPKQAYHEAVKFIEAIGKIGQTPWDLVSEEEITRELEEAMAKLNTEQVKD